MPPASIDPAEPFWRGWPLGRSMAVVVPLALYCAVFRLAAGPTGETQFSAWFILVKPAWLALLLGVFAFGAVVIAVRRRAEFRGAVVQWCVPPVFALSVTALRSAPMTMRLLVLGFGISLSVSAALFRFAIWRGERETPWPKHWLWDSILWGFAQIGVAGFVLVAGACCLTPLFV